MNEICVKAQGIFKRFYLLKKRSTLLNVLKAVLRRESLRSELWVLRDVSFSVGKGDKVAIIGKNGAGKTTLLRIISGIYDKTAGCLEVNERPLAIFKFLIGLNVHLLVVDNIYLLGSLYGIPKEVLRVKEDAILETAELKHLKFSVFKKLSTGQQQRLALSVFFQVKGDFFIFDESTSLVDLNFAHKCEAYFNRLFSPQTTVLMTSHDNSLLRKYCTKALWLQDGRVKIYGGIENVLKEYEQDIR